MSIAMALNSAIDFIQQSAGNVKIFDTIALFPEYTNQVAHLSDLLAQVAELVDALVSGTSE